MKKAPSGKLDEALATEVALRERIKAVLSCSIAAVGDSYTLTAKVDRPAIARGGADRIDRRPGARTPCCRRSTSWRPASGGTSVNR